MRGDLEQKREAHREYCESTVYPALRLSNEEREQLSFEGIARRIADRSTRRRFCELSIELLDANIASYQADATPVEPNAPRATWVVASTLVAAAVAHYFHGAAAALVTAAVWYWLASEMADRINREAVEHVQVHNRTVPEWAQTLAGWEASRNALRSMLASH